MRVDGERGTAAELQEPHIGGWYAAGLVVQCLLWALLFLSIVLAVLGGAGVSEFRYVGF